METNYELKNYDDFSDTIFTRDELEKILHCNRGFNERFFSKYINSLVVRNEPLTVDTTDFYVEFIKEKGYQIDTDEKLLEKLFCIFINTIATTPPTEENAVDIQEMALCIKSLIPLFIQYPIRINPFI
jgi:hypothetical protein